MIAIHRNASALFLLHALLLTAGCGSTPSAPETDAPPHAVYFTDADLRAITPPRHMPPAQPLCPPEPTPEAQPRYFAHTIKTPGETLIAIARWYTGNGGNWKQLTIVNRGLDPRRLGIGDTILIPEAMLRTRSPMPKSALSPRLLSKPSSPPAPPPKVVTPPPLFGPIESAPPAAPEGDTTLSQPLQPLDK